MKTKLLQSIEERGYLGRVVSARHLPDLQEGSRPGARRGTRLRPPRIVTGSHQPSPRSLDITTCCAPILDEPQDVVVFPLDTPAVHF